MRVLILADRSFALREHALLRRLEVGLIDEGVQLARAVPEGCDVEESTGLALSATYRDKGLQVFVPSPSESLLIALKDTKSFAPKDEADAPIDVIHAWGDRAWPIALDLAKRAGACLALEIWSAQSLAKVHSFEHRAHDLEATGATGLWLAPDHAMLDTLSDDAPRWPVMHSDWGVHVPPWEPLVHGARESVALAVMASGRDTGAITNCLSGLARSLSDHEDAVVFLDEAAVHKHPAVWKHAQALGLLPRLSIVSSMESRRDPVLRADILIQPEARGEHRTIILQAMAQGACVVAQNDPLVEAIDEQRALLIDEPNPDGWARVIRRAMDDADLRAKIGSSARSYITGKRLGHQHVAATLEAYQSLMEERPLPFAEVGNPDSERPSP